MQNSYREILKGLPWFVGILLSSKNTYLHYGHVTYH